MKTRTEKRSEGTRKEETSRLFIRIALPIVIAVTLFGGACSSLSSPMSPETEDLTEETSVVDDSTSAAKYEAIGSQILGGIFIIADMADSLDAKTSR